MTAPISRSRFQYISIERNYLGHMQKPRGYALKTLVFFLRTLDQKIRELAKSSKLIRIRLGSIELIKLQTNFSTHLLALLLSPCKGLIRLC